MAENTSSSLGDDLSADCLLEIFSYLSLDDMMQVKNVCKNWYQVSQHWFKQMQTLLFNYSFCGAWELRRNYMKREIFTGSDYIKLVPILQLYGHHVKYYQTYRSLDSKPLVEREEEMFQLVPKLCKNIVEFQICETLSYPPSAYKLMATHWKKLEKLSIRYLSHPVGEDVFELLRNNEQLKTVSFAFNIVHDCHVDDEFFTHLPTTIQEINISFNTNYNELLTYFIIASKNFTSLRSLKFFNLHHLSDAAVVAIADIKSLIHLSLIRVERYESRGTLYPIASLKDLKSLDLLYNSDLREDSLINIVESCTKLEQLDIFHQNMLTDRGMAAIAKLEGLKILGIDATNVTGESIISSCGSLEVFRCYDSKINDSDAIKFLEKATNLRLVEFRFCCNLTPHVIQDARKFVNERKGNILCFTGNFGCFYFGEKITPYFKYYEDLLTVPLALFPNYIKNYIQELKLFNNLRL